MNKTILFVALLSGAALAPAQPAKLLRIKPKPGQTFSYRMLMDSGAGSQNMKIAMVMNMKVTGVKPNATTITSTIGSVSMNGNPLPANAAEQIKKMLIVTTMDDRGKILKSETKGVPNAPKNQGGLEGSTVPFPANPVQVGSTWKGQATFQGTKFDTTYKLVSFKTVSGKQAAVIHATPVGLKEMQLEGPMVFSIELANGLPISMTMKGTVTQGALPQKITMSMSRI